MLLVRHPDTFLAERTYVLGLVFGEFMRLDWKACVGGHGAVEITLAGQQDARRLVVVDGLFRTAEHDWLSERSLPPRPLRHWDLRCTPITPTLVAPKVPVLYGKELDDGSFFAETADRLTLGLDLFGSIFFQLTRYEEIAQSARDEHDRFPASASISYQEGFLSRPLVNDYLEILRSAIERLWPRLRPWRPAFQERLSHDVDWPTHPRSHPAGLAKAIAGDIVRRHDVGLAGARLRALAARLRNAPTDDPYYCFDFIMDLSEERGLQSAFYFMAGRTNPLFDSTYSLNEPWIGALIRHIHERGHEVGLHPSYATFRDPSLIRSERDALVRCCEHLGISRDSWGGRQHFLRWENPVTWRAWEKADLTYDSSLGFSHHPGFRCGTCYEYPVFDLLARRALALRERPLIVMEMSVIDRGAKQNGLAPEIIETLRQRCRMFGGQFTLLWHNSRLASTRERRIYEESL